MTFDDLFVCRRLRVTHFEAQESASRATMCSSTPDGHRWTLPASRHMIFPAAASAAEHLDLNSAGLVTAEDALLLRRRTHLTSHDLRRLVCASAHARDTLRGAKIGYTNTDVLRHGQWTVRDTTWRQVRELPAVTSTAEHLDLYFANREQFPNLSELSLRYTTFSDGSSLLGLLPSLQVLLCNLVDTFWYSTAGRTNLTSLTLRNTKWVEEHENMPWILSNLPKSLCTLDIDVGIVNVFPTLPSQGLRSLTLRFQGLRPFVIDLVGLRFPKLELLSLRSEAPLRNWPTLKKFRTTQLSRALPRLKRLELYCIRSNPLLLTQKFETILLPDARGRDLYSAS